MANLRSDQLDVANKLLALLRERGIVGLQAPTGWGKSYVASYVIRQLGGKWVWASSLINALAQASRALGEFGVRHFLSTGRERLCTRGFRHSDFVVRRPCGFCQLNKPVPLVKALINASDYAEVRDLAEQGRLCPYNVQEALIRELLGRYDDIVVLMNYSRLGKYAGKVGGVIIDEAHNAVIPKLVSLSRRGVELLLGRLGVEDLDVRSAELVRGVLSELLPAMAMDGEVNEIVSMDDLVAFIESSITYYDQDSDALVGVRFEGLELPSNKRVLLMSATLPPSILTSIPVVRVEPSQLVRARLGSVVMTTENVERLKSEVARQVNDLLSDGALTVIFTTSSKEVLIENAVYEDEVRREDVCRRNLVLRFFGRFAEGVRLNCYRRAVLLTLPLLPSNVMRRLEARGLRSTDLVVMKTVQAIGRLMPNEVIDVVLFDRRFRRYCAELTNYGIQCTKQQNPG
ncbi:hypothetical protein [Vulcanisaeta distributa]|uniref:Helicase ATP-binding domain-containing protein n=1 Tax=Vulcanisaeta distributa (strain DSM 14429 / JCM 11212 / NBRC 100878 / IC-017) TaxID=572478 RepID=E1QSM6_VULDI|nr:hypothetical protein [Vulcanisaeta distributa]ADN49543.1 hypothetical protein Vdis_0130 [Vulcanisaeta distributa DSM 14429]